MTKRTKKPLTLAQAKAVNPFVTSLYAGMPMQHLGTVDRSMAIRTFTAHECRVALKLPRLGNVVTLALERRLRALEKEKANR